MAKNFGGMGGMGGMDMGKLMKQAQKMQQQMQEKAKELEESFFEASAGGGAVSVKMNGKKELTEVILDKDAVDPDDVEMLQDLIMAAVNEAGHKVDNASADVMGRFNGLL